MVKLQFILLTIFLNSVIYAQNIPLKTDAEICKPTNLGFTEFNITFQGETIHFYVYTKHLNNNINTVVLDIAGSSPTTLYRYYYNEKSELRFLRKIPGLNKFPKDWAYVVASKIGMPFCTKKDSTLNLDLYNKFNDKETWTKVNSKVVDYIKRKIFRNASKIIAVGRSEGAYITPTLALMNKRVTHICCWGGGYLSDFYDFAINERWKALKGEISQEECKKEIVDTVFRNYTEVFKNPNSLNKIDGYTAKRWASYSKPVLYDLVKLNIPIFLSAGGNDWNSPIESSYVVALEFIRLGKKNLTYHIDAESNHNGEIIKNGKVIDMSDQIWYELFEWARQ